MRTKINTSRVRNDLTKSKTYKKRNWPKYIEKKESKINEISPEKSTNNTKSALAQNKLERTPKKDFCDFSGEEFGYFKVGNNIVNIIFPR